MVAGPGSRDTRAVVKRAERQRRRAIARAVAPPPVPRAKVGDLGRNNIDGCRRFYLAHGVLTADEADTMAMLQDDPDELTAVMLRERWKVVSSYVAPAPHERNR